MVHSGKAFVFSDGLSGAAGGESCDHGTDHYRRNRFFVWKDMQEKGFRFKKYRLQTKVVLVTSAALILVPAVFYFFMEYADLPVKDRFLASLFQAVTPRTAGFNTTDLPKWERGDRC